MNIATPVAVFTIYTLSGNQLAYVGHRRQTAEWCLQPEEKIA